MKREVEFNSRKLILQGMSLSEDTLDLLSSEKFLAMLPAYSESETGLVMQIAQVLIGVGCVEICCVGSESSQLHDALDDLLEDQLEATVVTTSFIDEREASEYFIFGADGAEARLLIAFVGEHEGVVDNLFQMTKNWGGGV